MGQYEDGRVRRLAEALASAKLASPVVEQVMAGGEDVRRASKPEDKAEWLRGAMERLDGLVDEPTRHALRERCACCLGGKRLAISRAIAREHETLESRVAAANEAKLVFGHSVTLREDGRVRVLFSAEGQSEYRCVCLPRAGGPVPVTYCYCCGGHAKHHLQIALDRKLAVTVESSALESAGARPCAFLFSFAG